MADYTSSSQQRLLAVLDAMEGHDLDGISVAELADSVGTNKANIVRTLANLEMKRYVERLPYDGQRWRYGEAILRKYRNHNSNLLDAMQRLLDRAMTLAHPKNGTID